MRIISKYHDYYDGVSAFGFDDTFIYKRKTETITHKNKCPWGNNYWSNQWSEIDPGISMYRVLVGFCGRLYPAYHITWTRGPMSKTIVDRYVYDSDTFYNVIAEHLDKKATAEFNEVWFEKGKKFRWWARDINKSTIENHFNLKTPQFEKLFVELKVPSFVYQPVMSLPRRGNRMELVVNPCLKALDFCKVVDAYTAHQEIDMFLSGVLGNTEVDTVGICDKDMRDQKGFDDWSFKKLPTKRKKK